MDSYYLKKESPLYPQRLKKYSNMPTGIYVKGELPDEHKKTVAIIGARSCSDYGKKAAYDYARVLSANGIQIVSGLAEGIDSYAHRGCIDGGSPTFGILGCGIDLCYPRSNEKMYHDILKAKGGLISEYESDSPPFAYHFPVRNRIISALSDAVLIVEARIKSGSLITASYALDQGVPVYCIPGRVTDSLSAGTNALIADGAAPALSPEYLLFELGIINNKKEEAEPPQILSTMSDFTQNIYKTITSYPQTLDMICEKAGADIASVSESLLFLELNGCIYQPSPGLYAIAYR